MSQSTTGEIPHKYIRNNSVEKVRNAIERGANVNAKTEHGETPLMAAESKSYTKIIWLLKKHGAE